MSDPTRRLADTIELIDLRHENATLRTELQTYAQETGKLIEQLAATKRAARYIHDRSRLSSGSLAMAEGDELCKSVGLDVWAWPIQIN